MMKDQDVRRKAPATLALCAILACGAAACLTPGPPPSIRWFSASADHPLDKFGPSATVPTSGAEAEDDESAPRPSLRLRRVTAARHLGERIAWRQGAEYGFRELARWTELPDAVVARAFERALFESGAYVRDGRSELALDVEVRAFEEVRPEQRGGTKVARVELALLMSGVGERALLDRTLVAETPLEGEGGEALAVAIRHAIAEVTNAALGVVSAAANGT